MKVKVLTNVIILTYERSKEKCYNLIEGKKVVVRIKY